MNTTDNEHADPKTAEEAEQQRIHSETGNDPNKQEEEQRPEDLVRAEVAAPISESQVQPGRELVDGNGRRDIPETKPTRPDVLEDKDAVTQAKLDRLDNDDQVQRDHAKEVQDRQNEKLAGEKHK